MASAPVNTSAWWEVLTGTDYCHIVGDGGNCVTDGQGDYETLESCDVRAVQDLSATATYFHTEASWDYVDFYGCEDYADYYHVYGCASD